MINRLNGVEKKSAQTESTSDRISQVGQTIRKHPQALLVVGLAVGIVVGWLVKRK